MGLGLDLFFVEKYVLGVLFSDILWSVGHFFCDILGSGGHFLVIFWCLGVEIEVLALMFPRKGSRRAK